MIIKVKKLRPDAVLPKFAHGNNEDAGADLVAVEDVLIHAGMRAIVPCGFSMELPPGYEAQIRSRSGLAAKHGIVVANSPGTVDPGYRGEIKVILLNTSQESLAGCYSVKRGDRIAQMIIARYERVVYEETKGELRSTVRNDGGFGSTH